MTWLGTLMALYPLFILSMIAMSGISFIVRPNLWAPMIALFFLYLFPVLSFRVHKKIFGSSRKISYLVNKGYSPWWGGHQIQWIFIAFPFLEVLLRMVPGLFSVWLRLWGAKVGKSVYWTPALEITDRDLIEIGDHVIIGHRVGFYAHVIKPKNDNLLLFLRSIKIGDGAFIGAGSRIGPGVKIAAGSLVPTASELFPNSKVD